MRQASLQCHMVTLPVVAAPAGESVNKDIDQMMFHSLPLGFILSQRKEGVLPFDSDRKTKENMLQYL